jgi:hypothetical protein
MLDQSIGFNSGSAVNGFDLASNSTSSGEKKTESKTKSYRYPLKRIESKSDYLEIKIVDYFPPGYEATEITTGTVQDSKDKNKQETAIAGASVSDLVQGNSKYSPKTKANYYVYLPIPQNISDTNQITWGDDSINPLQSFGMAVAAKGISDPIKTAGYFFNNQIGSNVANALGTNKDVIAATVGGAIVNALGGNVNYESILSRATGQILNPNLELLFQGSNIRSFPFTFDFAPRDRREAQEVKNIIRTFKQSMVPRTDTSGGPIGSGIFIKSPNVFLISYKSGNKAHPFLNRFKACALLDMNLSYTGSGTYATYQDGTPVHMQMTLTFKELNPIYAEDYDTDEGQIGVGY